MKFQFATLALLAAVAMVAAADFNVPRAGFDVKMDPEMTVDALKDIVSGKLGLNSQDIKLVVDGKELDESHKLADYSITSDSSIDYKLTEEGERKQASSTTQNTYFGVDANDEAAVREKQRELSEAKFRELFGDEVHFQMDNHHLDEHDQQPPVGEKKFGSVKDALGWMFNLVKRGLGRHEDSTSTTLAPTSQ